jgi:hypothetical protein
MSTSFNDVMNSLGMSGLPLLDLISPAKIILAGIGAIPWLKF